MEILDLVLKLTDRRVSANNKFWALAEFLSDNHPNKQFVAVATQASTDPPQIDSIINTLGYNILWAYVSPGVYSGTDAEGDPIFADWLGDVGGVIDANRQETWAIKKSSDTEIILETATGAVLTDELLVNTQIHFEIG